MSSAEETEASEAGETTKVFKVIIYCDVCEEGKQTVAIVKCWQCEEHFCQECSKYHGRQKATRDHQLDEILETEASRNFCVNHDEDVAVSFCLDCNCQICEACHSTIHNDHKVENLDSLALDVRNKLDTGIKDYSLRAEMIQMEGFVEETIIEKNNIEKQRRKEIERIQERRDKLHKRVDTWCEELCDNVRAISDFSITRTDMEIARVQKKTKQISDVLQKKRYMQRCTDRLILVKQGQGLLQDLKELSDAEPEQVDQKAEPTPIFYSSAEPTAELLGVAFGKVSIDGSVKSATLSPISSFSVDSTRAAQKTNSKSDRAVYFNGSPTSVPCSNNVSSLAMASDNTVWISRKNGVRLDLYDVGGTYHHSRVCQLVPIGITAAKDGGWLITMENATRVFSLTKEGQIDVWCDTGEFFPKGLFFRKDTDLLYVCGQTIRHSKYSGILRSEKGGKSLKRIDNESYDVGSLRKITANSLGKICVTDTRNLRVIIFTPDGTDSYFFPRSGSKMPSQWRPLNVATDSSDCFLVLSASMTTGPTGDMLPHSTSDKVLFLHIISEIGDELKLLNLNTTIAEDTPAALILHRSVMRVACGAKVYRYQAPKEI